MSNTSNATLLRWPADRAALGVLFLAAFARGCDPCHTPQNPRPGTFTGGDVVEGAPAEGWENPVITVDGERLELTWDQDGSHWTATWNVIGPWPADQYGGPRQVDLHPQDPTCPPPGDPYVPFPTDTGETPSAPDTGATDTASNGY